MGGAYFYFTHPRRIHVEIPPDLRPHAEDVYRITADGARLHAIWIRAAGADSDRTIIQHHGFNGAAGLLMADDHAPLMAWPLVRAARERGYNLLLVDARAHGLSEGPWATDGRRLLSDLTGWARWLRMEHRQLWLGFWGNSLGAMLGLLLAVRPASGGLDAFVLDSIPISADGLYTGLLGPSATLIVRPVLQKLTEEARARAFPDGRLVAKSRGWPPVLLIHGENDRHVPIEHSERAHQMLCEAGSDGKCEFWRIPGADHLQGLDVAGSAYSDRMLDWFDRCFDGDEWVKPEVMQLKRAWLAVIPAAAGGACE